MSKTKSQPQMIDATDEVIAQAREILTERHDREPTFDELRFLAECIQQEIDEEDHKEELEREEQAEADAKYAAIRDAFEALVRGVVPMAESLGWEVTIRSCSHSASRYYVLDKNGQSLDLRVSDHVAKNGAGFNRETGLPHDECDVNIVAGRDTLDTLRSALELV
jgi:hypothetical protein